MQNFSNFLSLSLLSELGEDLGLKLTFDEHDQCLLVLDENLMISIRQSEDSWVLYGMLGEFWQPDSDFFQYLLSLNQSLAEQGLGALTFDPQNNTVLYLRHISLGNVSRATLYQLLESFTDWQESLMQRLDERTADKDSMQKSAVNLMIHNRPQGRRIA